MPFTPSRWVTPSYGLSHDILLARCWASLTDIHLAPNEAVGARMVRQPRGWPFAFAAPVPGERTRHRHQTTVTLEVTPGTEVQRTIWVTRSNHGHVNAWIDFLLHPDSEGAALAVRALVPPAPTASLRPAVSWTEAQRQAVEGALARNDTNVDAAAPDGDEADDVEGPALAELLSQPLSPEEARQRLTEVADATRADQISLLPEQRPQPILARVPLRAIRFTQRPISQQFLDSVHAFGILQPVVVVGRGNGVEYDQPYQLVAGRRRLTAAQRLGMTEVPVAVFPAGTSARVAASISLTENAQRSPNPVSDWSAIQVLLHEGATLQQIREQLGMDTATLNMRMRLGRLLPGILMMLGDGRISHSTALAAAALPHALQHRLLGGPFAMSDVRRLAGAGDGSRQMPLVSQQGQAATVRSQRSGDTDGFSVEVVYPDRQESVWVPRLSVIDVPLREMAQRVRGAMVSIERGGPIVLEMDGHVVRCDDLRIMTRDGQQTSMMRVADNIIPYQLLPGAAPAAPPVVDMGRRARRGAVDGPTDDVELTAEQLAAVEAEMARTPAAGAGEDTWARVTHLLELAVLCVPAAPDERHEAIYMQVQEAVAMVEALVNAEPEPVAAAPGAADTAPRRRRQR